MGAQTVRRPTITTPNWPGLRPAFFWALETRVAATKSPLLQHISGGQILILKEDCRCGSPRPRAANAARTLEPRQGITPAPRAALVSPDAPFRARARKQTAKTQVSCGVGAHMRHLESPGSLVIPALRAVCACAHGPPKPSAVSIDDQVASPASGEGMAREASPATAGGVPDVAVA
jgi:hypothetical protein